MTWGFVGSAAVSAVGGMLSSRSQKKAQKKADQAALEAQKQQRLWDVEDRDKMRAYDLEDRAARQGLLNPYAQYFKGEKLIKPPAPLVEAPPAAQNQPGNAGDRFFYDERIGMNRR